MNRFRSYELDFASTLVDEIKRKLRLLITKSQTSRIILDNTYFEF